ncbi:MAG: 3-oxoacyl-ACP synthase [Bacteroidetes bacterium]|nr:3-oxoacyl-ACP synthase [Bacteroidota bacterium]
MEHATLKKMLYEHCLQFVQERIGNIEQAIENARAAQQDDTKSSAGDKYETSREMMTQEIENNATQLAEARKQLQLLRSISPDKTHEQVAPGSYVQTSAGNFFIAIAAGACTTAKGTVQCISAASPMALHLLGKQKNDSVAFHGKSYLVEAVA